MKYLLKNEEEFLNSKIKWNIFKANKAHFGNRIEIFQEVGLSRYNKLYSLSCLYCTDTHNT